MTNGTTGRVEAQRSWVTLFAKDYGGEATIVVTLKGAGTAIATPIPLSITIPIDSNKNGIADVWEREKLEEWNAIYKMRLSANLIVLCHGRFRATSIQTVLVRSLLLFAAQAETTFVSLKSIAGSTLTVAARWADSLLTDMSA